MRRCRSQTLSAVPSGGCWVDGWGEGRGCRWCRGGVREARGAASIRTEVGCHKQQVQQGPGGTGLSALALATASAPLGLSPRSPLRGRLSGVTGGGGAESAAAGSGPGPSLQAERQGGGGAEEPGAGAQIVPQSMESHSTLELIAEAPSVPGGAAAIAVAVVGQGASVSHLVARWRLWGGRRCSTRGGKAAAEGRNGTGGPW